MTTVFILAESGADRVRLRGVLEKGGCQVECFANGQSLLRRCQGGVSGCLLLDARWAGWLDLLQTVTRAGFALPVVVMTGRIAKAVAAIRAGAADVVEKPVADADLLNAVRRAAARQQKLRGTSGKRDAAAVSFAGLTRRQLQVLQKVLAGQPSKSIAADLGISQRTVESHRAVIMHKTGARSLPALARLAVMANWYGDFQ